MLIAHLGMLEYDGNELCYIECKYCLRYFHSDPSYPYYYKNEIAEEEKRYIMPALLCFSSMYLLTCFWRTTKAILFLVISSGIVSIISAIIRLSNIVLWNNAEDSTYIGSVIQVLHQFFFHSAFS